LDVADLVAGYREMKCVLGKRRKRQERGKGPLMESWDG